MRINEFGEIIRDKDPNSKKEKKLSAGEIVLIFLGNLFSTFLLGLFLFFNFKSKDYDKKARQTCNITWISAVGIFLFLFLVGVMSEL